MTCGIGPVTAGILLSVTLILAFACSNNIVDARPAGELEPESLSSSTTQAATTSTTSTEFAIGATVEQVSSNGSPEVTTPEEEPEAEEEEPMDRGKVSLDIPDALFAASANLTLRLRDDGELDAPAARCVWRVYYAIRCPAGQDDALFSTPLRIQSRDSDSERFGEYLKNENPLEAANPWTTNKKQQIQVY